MNECLHVDIETFSSVDIKTCGSYKYIESIDFEILMIAYAFDDEPIQMIDLAQGQTIPRQFLAAMQDPDIIKKAHNANFERNCFKAYGIDVPASQWECTAVKSSYCGLPLSLDGVSKALNLADNGKSAEGTALIKYFCCPVKPTIVNGKRERNFPRHDLEKWERFKNYCKQDVVAERKIDEILSVYEFPEAEKLNYILDQKINDTGILIDIELAQNAIDIDKIYTDELIRETKKLTGVDNPNSAAQLKAWLSKELQKDIQTLAKDSLDSLINDATPLAVRVLQLRKKLSKTSIKKYAAMLAYARDNSRACGLTQFYGAGRTGRWAGRGVQLQNLVRNKMKCLAVARTVVGSGDYEVLSMLYDDLTDVLSQLIRTALIAKPGHTLGIADFSAIEARVLAWVAGEQWRLDVFNTHGKIYEASASAMFNVAIDSITKDSHYRDKGKIAELALGYQGAVNALKTMGGEKMGLSEQEMNTIVLRWRKANPAIVAFWANVEICAIRAVKTKKPQKDDLGNLIFECDGKVLTITLPSKRKLYYQSPTIGVNKWGKDSIKYKGMDQTTRQWVNVETYGGKITENVVQAIARDILADSLIRLDEANFDIVMHVHDEAAAELPLTGSEERLIEMCDIMGEPIAWAPGLPMKAEGYLTEFYKKD